MAETTIPALAGLWPYLLILFVGALPTVIWRWAGVALAGHVRENSEIFIWVRAVATALVAAVIAKLVLYPTGALADAPIALRLAAVAAGAAVFLAARQNLIAGLLVGEAVLIGGLVLL